MSIGKIHSLGLIKPTLDKERNEIRARGNELFAGRTIHWEKLDVVSRVRASISSDYRRKIRGEFKDYIQEKLLRTMNGRVQTYLNNNLSELKQSLLKINDLSVTDLKELSSIINDKETSLAIKHFAAEKAQLISDLIERSCLTSQQATSFIENHPEYQEIKSIEQFQNFKTTLYNEFQVPQTDRQ